MLVRILAVFAPYLCVLRPLFHGVWCFSKDSFASRITVGFNNFGWFCVSFPQTQTNCSPTPHIIRQMIIHTNTTHRIPKTPPLDTSQTPHTKMFTQTRWTNARFPLCQAWHCGNPLRRCFSKWIRIGRKVSKRFSSVQGKKERVYLKKRETEVHIDKFSKLMQLLDEVTGQENNH